MFGTYLSIELPNSITLEQTISTGKGYCNAEEVVVAIKYDNRVTSVMIYYTVEHWYKCWSTHQELLDMQYFGEYPSPEWTFMEGSFYPSLLLSCSASIIHDFYKP